MSIIIICVSVSFIISKDVIVLLKFFFIFNWDLKMLNRYGKSKKGMFLKFIRDGYLWILGLV